MSRDVFAQDDVAELLCIFTNYEQEYEKQAERLKGDDFLRGYYSGKATAFRQAARGLREVIEAQSLSATREMAQSE